jgi:dephospho-CoA kinase
MTSMAPPRIIALIGSKRSGKDTVASILHQYGYENWKFAARLKSVCKELFGLTHDELETDLKDRVNEKWGVTPRYLMQIVGTEIVQHTLPKYVPSVSKEFWVKVMCDNIDENPSSQIIISDMRFIHEAEYIRNRYSNVLYIKLIRPESAIKDSSHISEKEWQKITADEEIINGGTLFELKQKVDQVCTKYGILLSQK